MVSPDSRYGQWESISNILNKKLLNLLAGDLGGGGGGGPSCLVFSGYAILANDHRGSVAPTTMYLIMETWGMFRPYKVNFYVLRPRAGRFHHFKLKNTHKIYS